MFVHTQNKIFTVKKDFNKKKWRHLIAKNTWCDDFMNSFVDKQNIISNIFYVTLYLWMVCFALFKKTLLSLMWTCLHRHQWKQSFNQKAIPNTVCNAHLFLFFTFWEMKTDNKYDIMIHAKQTKKHQLCDWKIKCKKIDQGFRCCRPFRGVKYTIFFLEMEVIQVGSYNKYNR